MNKFAFCSAALATAASAIDPFETQFTSIQGRINIPGNVANYYKHPLANVKLFLSDNTETRIAYPKEDGEFEIQDVPVGASYLLEIKHPALNFDPVTVETTTKGSDMETKIAPYLFDYLHQKGQKLRYPLQLAPSGVTEYFEPREDFNIFNTLKNPMTLMMIVMFGLMWLMPKMQPEQGSDGAKMQKKEIRETIKQGGMMAQVIKATYGDVGSDSEGDEEDEGESETKKTAVKKTAAGKKRA